MQNIIYGIILSKIYSHFVLPNKCKEIPNINFNFYPIFFKGMLIIPLSKKQALHIHHWVIYLLIIIGSLFINIPEIIIGFSFGLFIQGMQYEDCFTFIHNNPYIENN